jgi:hypothetical protein
MQVPIRPALCHHHWSAARHEHLLSTCHPSSFSSLCLCNAGTYQTTTMPLLCPALSARSLISRFAFPLQVPLGPARCYFYWSVARHERLLSVTSATHTEHLRLCLASSTTSSMSSFCLAHAGTYQTSRMPPPSECCCGMSACCLQCHPLKPGRFSSRFIFAPQVPFRQARCHHQWSAARHECLLPTMSPIIRLFLLPLQRLCRYLSDQHDATVVPSSVC